MAVIVGGVLWWVKGFFNREISVTGTNTKAEEERALIFPFAKDKLNLDEYILPKEEKDRLDILILGLRGKDDPDGGLLTDTIMLFSYDRQTKRSSLVSIPRDLYVYLDDKRANKINAAYETLGLKKTRLLFSKITGVYIDNAVVFDFAAFKQIVDGLGGIDVTLDNPFYEKSQWGYEFSLPAGANHLDGEQALYFARSRYSSSDFDRARRQQQIISAIKTKVGQMDLLSNPLDALSFLNTVRNHITTDFNLTDTGTLIGLAKDFENVSGSMRREVLSPDNLLYHPEIPEIYILLPKGDSLKPVQEYFRGTLTPIKP
jgi:LCP family protein required for cell wall assembly